MIKSIYIHFIELFYYYGKTKKIVKRNSDF